MGAGIIGIPYAFRQTGLCAGWVCIVLSAVLGCKSLRLLVETAKHVDAPSYESECQNMRYCMMCNSELWELHRSF